jgi:trehalose 2-sulfotransferase
MSAVPVENGYLLCSSPRSGSTMLCDLLRRSGLGVPESLFRPNDIEEYAQDWGLTASTEFWDRNYVDAARRYGSGGTGCFGVRIMGSHMPGFLARLAELYPQSSNDRTRLRTAFGIEHYVHLSRQDKLAEAVSLAMARQTGLWHRHVDGSERERSKPHEQPYYDRAAIALELQMLQDEAVGWRSWFGTCGISPLVVTYEDLAADPTGQFNRVLGHLGIPDTTALQPGTAKMSNDLNVEWSSRFRSEVNTGGRSRVL